MSSLQLMSGHRAPCSGPWLQPPSLGLAGCRQHAGTLRPRTTAPRRTHSFPLALTQRGRRGHRGSCGTHTGGDNGNKYGGWGWRGLEPVPTPPNPRQRYSCVPRWVDINDGDSSFPLELLDAVMETVMACDSAGRGARAQDLECLWWGVQRGAGRGSVPGLVLVLVLWLLLLQLIILWWGKALLARGYKRQLAQGWHGVGNPAPDWLLPYPHASFQHEQGLQQSPNCPLWQQMRAEAGSSWEEGFFPVMPKEQDGGSCGVGSDAWPSPLWRRGR